MLQSASRATNIDYALTINEEYTIVEFNENYNELKDVQLIVNDGVDDILCTRENGKIRDFKISFLAQDVREVTFRIVLNKFTIDVEDAALTLNEEYGLRLVGTTKVYYPDSKVRRGVIKLEFDLEN